MCAIAGLIGFSVEDGILNSMLETMKRRGPDGSGCCRGRDYALLHTRLAIIDPDGGGQPMRLEWEGETYTIVYNGELYNTMELRKELETLGHCFETHSDTEVLLHGFAQWGSNVVEHLNGIFAFGIWEGKRKRLFLARDRLGVKPLFYSFCEDGLIFASEIKTILAYPGMKRVIDSVGVAQLLLLGPGRLPGSGVFRDVYELEPGCRGWFEQKRFRAERYWRLVDREHTQSLPETVEYVRYLVEDSIRRQMVSDVPIGCFLSGGLDSSIISTVCAGRMKEKGQQLMTFCVDYQDNELFFRPGAFQPNADNAYIKIMCEHLNSNHHCSILRPQQLLENLEDATIARDLPGMADVDFSLLAFCGDIRRYVKVALSGECADEIFGGYPWYRDPKIRDMDGFPWAQNTARRIQFLSPDVCKSINGQEWIHDIYEDTLNASDILPGTSALEKRMKQMVNLNVRWFMQTLLDRKDRMSMYHGLEVRVPFCDHRIAEYMYGVPWEMKDYMGKEKGLLREAVKDLLPHQVLYRKKSPYPKTHHPEYERIVSDRLNSLLNDKASRLFMLLSREALETYINDPGVWPWYGQLMTRPQTMAYFLQLHFWLEYYQIDFVD